MLTDCFDHSASEPGVTPEIGIIVNGEQTGPGHSTAKPVVTSKCRSCSNLTENTYKTVSATEQQGHTCSTGCPTLSYVPLTELVDESERNAIVEIVESTITMNGAPCQQVSLACDSDTVSRALKF